MCTPLNRVRLPPARTTRRVAAASLRPFLIGTGLLKKIIDRLRRPSSRLHWHPLAAPHARRDRHPMPLRNRHARSEQVAMSHPPSPAPSSRPSAVTPRAAPTPSPTAQQRQPAALPPTNTGFDAARSLDRVLSPPGPAATRAVNAPPRLPCRAARKVNGGSAMRTKRSRTFAGKRYNRPGGESVRTTTVSLARYTVPDREECPTAGLTARAIHAHICAAGPRRLGNSDCADVECIARAAHTTRRPSSAHYLCECATPPSTRVKR